MDPSEATTGFSISSWPCRRPLEGMEARRTRNSYLGGGYAACFENALLRVSREAKHHFSDDQVEVVAEIGLSRNEEGSFVLSASLAVTLEGVDQAMGEEFVHRAHKICPYSNAIRGNVDVAISVTIR